MASGLIWLKIFGKGVLNKHDGPRPLSSSFKSELGSYIMHVND
jgi:hypothetical protein